MEKTKRKDTKISQATKELVKESGIEPTTHDLKTFIFDKNQIIQKKVFTSHLLKNSDIFGFGLLLPRTEDLLDRKGNRLGEVQRWRPVVITSDKRGLALSEWMRQQYKINYDAIPYEMKLRWELEDINNYLHGNPKIISGKELFQDIKKQYENYLYFHSVEWYDVNSLWDMGTYFSQLFSSFPLKEERGLTTTGKTKTMLVSSMITLNATDIMVNPSEATLFRETDEKRPSKYIDEAEKLFKHTSQGLEPDNRVELINASYSRNGVVPRQERIGGTYTTKWYHVYSPTRISSINGLFGATETRAITQVHTKAPDRDVRGETDPEDDFGNPKWSEIRNKCYLFALQNWKEVYDKYLHFKTETKLKKRDLQLWKPLLVLAEIIDRGELLPSMISFAEKISEQRKSDFLGEGTMDYKLLFCLNQLFPAENDKIYINQIRTRLNENFRINDPADVGYNKTISTHLDKLGFKELREKDRYGAFYNLTKNVFDELISPLTNDFSSQSSQSSQDKGKEQEKSDECEMNVMNNNNNKEINLCDDVTNPKTTSLQNLNPNYKGKCDECDGNDECDGESDRNDGNLRVVEEKIK